MPKYKVPPERNYHGLEPPSKKKQQPSVTIPMKPEWLGNINVGDGIELTIKGEVTEVRMSERKEYKDSEVTIAASTVEYYKKGEVDKVFDDAEEDS